jgi:prepilin-type processing-associated H-X9-DG protein
VLPVGGGTGSGSPPTVGAGEGGTGYSSSNYDYSGFIGSSNSGAGRQSLSDMAEVGSGGGYVCPLEPGPYIVKLSDEQYQEAQSMGLLLGPDSPEACNVRAKYDCTYKPGANPHVYWLCFEDGGRVADFDFSDAMFKVTEESGGTIRLYINDGHTAVTNNRLISKIDGHTLLPLPSDVIGLQWTLRRTSAEGDISVTPWDGTSMSPSADNSVPSGYGTPGSGGSSDGWLPPVATNYGMNSSRLNPNEPARLTTSPGRIALLDYPIHVADSTDNWSDSSVVDLDGVPVFARHGRGPERKINVLFTDGSVQAMRPEEIDPLLPSTEWKYWLP